MAKNVEKILLVDDEPDIRTIGELSLSKVGMWNTLVAASGKEALTMGEAEQPDLILLDVMMPEMDGPTTLARLREIAGLRDVPVIFLTAKVQKNEVERYMGLGVLGVIRKPFDPMTLPTQIRELLAEAN